MNITTHYIKAITDTVSPDCILQSGDKWCADVTTGVIKYDSKSLQDANNLPICRAMAIHEAGHLKYTNKVSMLGFKPEKKNNTASVFNWLEDVRMEYQLLQEKNIFTTSSLYYAYDLIASKKQTQLTELDTIQILPFLALQEERRALLLDNNLSASDYHMQRLRGLLPNSSITISLSDIISKATTTDLLNWFTTEILPKIDHLIQPDTSDDKDNQGKSKATDDPTDQETSKVLNLGSGLDGGNSSDIRQNSYYPLAEARGISKPYSTTLASRIQSVLTQNASIRFTGSKLRGRLLSKNIYKIATDTIRVFSKKQQKDASKYAFYIAIDISGSTQGDTFREELIAYTLLQEVAKKLGFNFSAITYGSEINTINQSNEARRLETPYFEGSTYDLEAVQHLAPSLDSNSIVFFLTDGRGDTSPRHIKQLVKNTGCYFFGIGLGCNASASYSYGDYGINVPNITKLPEKILALMREVFKRE